MRFILCVILLLSYLTASQTQSIQPKSFDFPYDVKVYDLPTSSNGINYRLYVRKPLREPAEGEKASAFYFLDPLSLFIPASSMTGNYEWFNYLPAAYYIGVGYANEADGIPKEENRTRDYTPTEFFPPDSSHFLAANPVDYLGSGGADRFIEVLRNEIIPFINANFPVDEKDNVLIGKSMSGLATVHCLLTAPDLFKRYLIISPAIWWDDWLKPRQQRYIMKQVAALNADLFKNDVRAYFAVGDAEERFGLVTDLYVLADGLRKKRIDQLKIFLDVLENELHEGVFPIAFMKGIVGVYADEENRRSSASPVKWD